MKRHDQFGQALLSHQNGDLGEAERQCNAILESVADHADALDLLATIHRQRGRREDALRPAEKAVAAEPGSALFLFHLGDCYRSLGRFEEAIAAYQRSLHVSEMPQAYRALGHAYAKTKRFVEATDSFRHSIRRDPNCLSAHRRLIECLMAIGRWAEAAAACRKAIALAPENHELRMALGDALLRQGICGPALENFQEARRLSPGSVQANVYAAVAAHQLRRWSEAADAARAALALDSHHVAVHRFLASAMLHLGNLTRAAEVLERLHELIPGDIETPVVLANIELARLNHDRATSLLQNALGLAKGSSLIHSKLLMGGNYCARVDEQSLFDQHRNWGNAIAARGKTDKVTTAFGPERPLRIGYVSADLREHSVAYFIEPILTSHDRTNYEPIVFSNTLNPDAVTRRLRGQARRWHDTWRMNDERLAALIHRERIDILVDLGGHTAFNRLPLFAKKVAAVQVTYLGYPNTTGLPRDVMHYRLTDAICDPPGETDRMHTETLWRLPQSFLCYRPPAEAPDVGDPPAESSGAITFGCFNNIAKISHDLLRLWAMLLLAVPDSRLLLKNTALGDPCIREQVARRFEESAIGVERLTLLGRDSSAWDHLSRYHEVDIALDTFPYNGATTTCEALWIGVPVVTLAGVPHRSRVGATILRATGTSELVATSREEYVRIAAELGGRRRQLRELRAGLRERVRTSRLTDAEGFTRDLESAYRTMWRQACSGEIVAGAVR